jgi:hypothetical protein
MGAFHYHPPLLIFTSLNRICRGLFYPEVGGKMTINVRFEKTSLSGNVNS